MDDGGKSEARDIDAPITPDASAGAPRFDADRYAEHIEGLDLSDEQAREFLEALWSIMVAFVDVGFRVDSVSQIFPEIFEEDGKRRHTELFNKNNKNGGHS